MPNPTSARPDWTFDPRKPEAERTLKADQIKEYLLTDAADLEVENAVIAGPFKARELREFHHFVIFRRCRFLDAFDVNDVHFHRSVHMIGCDFRGNLDLSCTEIDGDLSLEDTTVAGNLDIHDALVHDHLYLTGTQVGGNLELVRSEVLRNLFCTPTTSRRPSVGGKADLAALEVHGQTILMGLHVKGNLNLQQVELRAGLFCRAWSGGPEPSPTQVDGSVLLLSAKVQDLLDFSGAVVGHHVDVSRAVINGQADFSGTSLGGNFDMQGTKVANDLRLALRDAPAAKDTSKGADGPEANLQDCVIAHMVYDAAACPNRLVKLNFAQVDVLDFPESPGAKPNALGRWPRLASIPQRTRLEGLRFRDFEFPAGRDESAEAMNWLRSDPEVPESTTRQIEKWFRNKGNHEKANVFYLVLQRRQRRTRPYYMQVLEKLIIDWGTSYGLRTSRLLVLFVILFGVSFVLFQHDGSAVIREDRGGMAREETPAGAKHQGERFVADWNWVDAMWMALHLNLPMVELPATSDWKPSDETLQVGAARFEAEVPRLGWHLRLSYRDYGSLVAMLGYIMVPLYFAGTIHYWFQQRRQAQTSD